MRTFKLTLEYDGTDFSGWQVQPNQRTIQGEIEKALRFLTQKDIRIIGSGRTDAGVHALGQVISFRSNSELQLSAFKNGLNAYLPVDVRVIRVEEAGDCFNARKDAVSRTYHYVLYKRKRAVMRRYGWYPGMDFSVDPMKQASEFLLGEHSFISFCKLNGQTGDLISRVLNLRWNLTEEEIIFEITANRFFHNMVRIIVGTLLDVGFRKISPEELSNIIEGRDRELAGPTVPPQGLFLVRVDY